MCPIDRLPGRSAESAPAENPFLVAFRGSFTSTLRWPQLDALWQCLRGQPEGWYVYAVGEPPPNSPATADDLLRFIDLMDALLRA